MFNCIKIPNACFRHELLFSSATNLITQLRSEEQINSHKGLHLKSESFPDELPSVIAYNSIYKRSDQNLACSSNFILILKNFDSVQVPTYIRICLCETTEINLKCFHSLEKVLQSYKFFCLFGLNVWLQHPQINCFGVYEPGHALTQNTFEGGIIKRWIPQENIERSTY